MAILENAFQTLEMLIKREEEKELLLSSGGGAEDMKNLTLEKEIAPFQLSHNRTVIIILFFYWDILLTESSDRYVYADELLILPL